MKRFRLLLPAVAAALLLAPVAQAKGPSRARVEGPGLKKAIVFRTSGFNGGGGGGAPSGTPLGTFVDEVGFFPSVFEQTPNPMQTPKPNGDLGPKYAVTYTVPGPYGQSFTLHQDVYPYAKPDPVAYMAPGQRIFDTKTRGGWYVSDSSLRSTLVEEGLPRSEPAGSSGGSAFSWLWDAKTLAILGGLALVAVTVAAIRRRPGPAQA